MTTEEQFESLKKINDVNVDRLAKICELTGGDGDAVAQVSAVVAKLAELEREKNGLKAGLLTAVEILDDIRKALGIDRLTSFIEGVQKLTAERDQWQRRAEDAELRWHNERCDNSQLQIELESAQATLLAAQSDSGKAYTQMIAAQAHAVKLRDVVNPERKYELVERVQFRGSLTDFLMDVLSILKNEALAITPDEALRGHDLALAERAFIAGAESVDERVSYDYAFQRWMTSDTRADALSESLARAGKEGA